MGGFSFAPTLIRQGLRNALMQSGQGDSPEGAPADFGGAVFPNPDGIKPRLDTDPGPATQLSPGASLSTPTYRGGAQMDTSNPPMNQMTPSLMQEVKSSDRINDDPATRHNVPTMDPMGQGSLADLESRVGTTARPQYRPAAPDDHMQQLETQYNQAANYKPNPLKLWQKIALGVTAPFGSLGAFQNERDYQQAEHQKQAQGLLAEIEAERRMQEQEQGQSQRLDVQERGENLRAEMQARAMGGQTDRLLMQMQEQDRRQQAGFDQANQMERTRESARKQEDDARFAEQERLEGERESNAQSLEDKRMQAMLGKQDLGTKEKVLTYWQPSLDSAERVNVMSKNFEDAVNNHDQQAMLSLLYNHMGMTMGLQKGARMTQDLIREAQQSQPWLQGLKAKFDKDGYLTGVNLSPQQMQQMQSLAFERYREDVKKSRSMAGYIGVKDEPPRQLSREAASWYAQQAGGDLNKARQMAQGDGWTF